MCYAIIEITSIKQEELKMMLKTRNGHNFFDMISMMEKAIKKKRISIASFCAYELYDDFREPLWRKLEEIAEDEEMKEEIKAMKYADDFMNKNSKEFRDPLFLAKAIVLLCMDQDKRNGKHETANVDIEKIKSHYCESLPEWVYDCHTLKGKRMGKTDLDMNIEEEKALTPKRNNVFDECSWWYAYYEDRKNGRMNDEEWEKFLEFAKGRDDGCSY